MTAPTAPTADGATLADGAVTPTSSPMKRRRLRLIAGIYWLIARLFAIALFAAGVALGYNAFLANQPPPPAVVSPAVEGSVAPAVVTEFIAALGSNNADALRSAVPPEPYQLLIAEMDRWGFVSITDIQTLSTFADGSRSATALVMTGPTTNGVPVSVNLVVHVDGGQIVSFR